MKPQRREHEGRMRMRTSLAAVVTAPDSDLEVVEVIIPNLEPGSILVKVEAATLCGTDVHRWRGSPGAVRPSYPYIPGHETCGSVVDMRDESYDLLGSRVEIGDRIVWSYPTCGRCYWCQVTGQTSLCPDIRVWGVSNVSTPPYLLGGLAEYQYIPDGCGIVKVPDGVPDEAAAASACAYRTVMHAFERLGPVLPHESVVVQGSGPLGLFASWVARAKGARQVLVVGAPSGRLRVAEALGADGTLDIEQAREPSARVEWVRARTAGRGADVVVQCATLDSMSEGLAMSRRGGRYLSIGVGGLPSISASDLWRSVSIIPTTMAEPRHWLQAIDFLDSHRGDSASGRLTSGSFGLAQATLAMRAMADFQLVKPVIRPHGQSS